MSTKAKLAVIVLCLGFAFAPQDKLRDGFQAVRESWGRSTAETADVDADKLLDDVLGLCAANVPGDENLTTANRLFDYWNRAVELAFGPVGFTPAVTERINAVWPAIEKALAIGATDQDLTGADRSKAGEVFASFIRPQLQQEK